VPSLRSGSDTGSDDHSMQEAERWQRQQTAMARRSSTVGGETHETDIVHLDVAH
jgi:hypothetical protein